MNKAERPDRWVRHAEMSWPFFMRLRVSVTELHLVMSLDWKPPTIIYLKGVLFGEQLFPNGNTLQLSIFGRFRP